MIKITKEITKRLSMERYYDEESFINDCKSYIKAVQSGRILYKVMTVSKSGMSRTISISSFEGTMTQGYYKNYINLLEAMGYKINDNGDAKITGCGMNMLFATNYNIIHSLHKMKFISQAKRDILAQKVN